MIDPQLFRDDPAACFQDDLSRLHNQSRTELENLQLAAIASHFAELADKIMPLGLLADAAGTTGIKSLDDVPALLFPHSFYKSYDDISLDYGHYNDLTDWIQRLSAVDLSHVRDREFTKLDEWIDTLERETGLVITHSSGTTGRLSFLPRSTDEVENNARYARMTIPDWSGVACDKKEPAQFSVIWTSFARGRSAVARGAHAFQHGYAKTKADFLALMPGELSADWHYYTMRVERAAAAGKPPPIATPYVSDWIDEMNAQHAARENHANTMLDHIANQLKGQRILLAGAPFVLHDFAEVGIKRGMTKAFGPDSAVLAFGGLKGQSAREGMAGTILNFSGARAISNVYVMTEASSALLACEHGYFHLFPWVVPFLIDPVTGAALPRDGVRTGRWALFDLLAKTYWGGLITADRVTLDWTPCACGRASARIHPDISRFEDGVGNGLPPCPAKDYAIREAMLKLRD